MTTGRGGLFADLEARGLVHDATDRDAIAARLDEGPLTLYYGCDPTAPSLHHGNLIGLLVLRRFGDAGHRPIALAGGATGMIGDPGGRSEERNLLDEETLQTNLSSIEAQMRRIVGEDVELVDNRSWTEPLGVIDFLRDIGKHATVNQMLARESVKARLNSEHGISFTEFAYMLLQANDYLWLYDHRRCELQIGGSDQWGNMVAGVDLVRRTRQAAVHALSWPLLTAPDGSKLGKTAGAPLWLDPERTSPYAFFQHWMQSDDRQVEQFLLQFTLLPVDEVAEVIAEHQRDPSKRIAQRRLADEATTLVHGPDETARAAAASAVLFGAPVDGIDEGTFATLAREIRTADLPRAGFADGGYDLVDLLADAGLAASRGDARRTIAQGGAYVNNQRAAAGAAVGPDDLRFGRYVLLRKGRREHALVVAS